MSHKIHQSLAESHAQQNPVRCAVLTISDTRTMETDAGGTLVIEHLRSAQAEIAVRAILPDDPAQLRFQLQAWLADPTIQAILTTGGTGIAQRDSTIEVVRDLLTHELEGFGELFRMLSWEQVKGAAMLSRAVGGLVVQEPDRGGDTFIFAMPGSTNAVETAMVNLIAPQLAHLVWERARSAR